MCRIRIGTWRSFRPQSEIVGATDLQSLLCPNILVRIVGVKGGARRKQRGFYLQEILQEHGVLAVEELCDSFGDLGLETLTQSNFLLAPKHQAVNIE
ncbi:hypothetical protein D3C87_583380 [compost metagenome]